jgi:hypothetical protein
VSELLTTAEAAARLGLSVGGFSNARGSWSLTEARRDGAAKLYDPADIERIARQRAAAKSAPRKPRAKKEETVEEELSDLERNSESWGHGRRTFGPLDARERAVIYQAWRDGTLGPSSPWRHTEPTASYRAAFESLRHVEQDDELAYSEPAAA